MNSIIKVIQKEIGKEKVNAISAKELHKNLSVGRDFSTWIKAQILRAKLVEDRDYIFFTQKGENSKGRPSTDYILTLDIAKHLAMMSGTKKGFEVREYFIQIEKEYQIKLLNNAQKQKNLLNSEKSKNTNLSLQLQDCKSKIEAIQKERDYIKNNALLKFQDMDLEISKAINQFTSIKLKSQNIKPISQDRLFSMIDNLFILLSLHSQSMADDFN